MTRQELREEMKQHEGNPADEAARSAARAMAISRNRMIRFVSMADVVIVNPTHYAVALKYDAAKGAPEVVAKGAGDDRRPRSVTRPKRTASRSCTSRC